MTKEEQPSAATAATTTPEPNNAVSITNTTVTSSISQLTALLTEEPRPTEFDIAILHPPEEVEESKGSLLFCQKSEHCLGIHGADLPWLARDFRKAYRDLRKNSNSSTSKAATTTTSSQPELVLTVTRCLLLVCPDHATAWADRKRSLNVLDDRSSNSSSSCSAEATRAAGSLLWNSELDFLNLLMTKHTKAPTAWFHRKYILAKIFQRSNFLQDLISIAKKEIQLCQKVAERYPKNYYAWTHRIHVLKSLVQQQQQTFMTVGDNDEDKQPLLPNLLQDEWDTVEPWLRSHVSDHSAAHFGGCILRMRLGLGLDGTASQHHCTIETTAKKDEEGLKLLFSISQGSLDAAKRLIATYPTHEALWIFRRSCSHAFLNLLRRTYQEEGLSSPSATAATTTSMTIIQQAASHFYKSEVASLLSENQQTIQQSTTSKVPKSEVEQENLRALTYQWSYVAWVLEHIKTFDDMPWIARLLSPSSSDKLPPSATDSLSTARRKVLSLLHHLDNHHCMIPYNVYRQNNGSCT